MARDTQTRPESNWGVKWRRYERRRAFRNFLFNASRALGIIGAVILAVTTAFNTYGTYRSTEEGLAREQFNRGVEELGTTNEGVQTAGIYTLVRMAKESSSNDAETTYQIILNFVRGNLCHNRNSKLQLSGDASFVGPPQSVVYGLQVLRENHRRIDLRHLRGCENADLANVDLTSADLTDALLVGVTFEGARFDGAILHCANVYGTNFTHHAYFDNADFSAADITHDGFEGAIRLTKEQVQSAYWNPNLPPSIDPDKRSWIAQGPSKLAVMMRRAC